VETNKKRIVWVKNQGGIRFSAPERTHPRVRRHPVAEGTRIFREEIKHALGKKEEHSGEGRSLFHKKDGLLRR